MRVWSVAKEQTTCPECKFTIRPGEQINKRGKQKKFRHNRCPVLKLVK